MSTTVYPESTLPRMSSGRAIRLTIPARPEYISLCRLALGGLCRTQDLDEDLVSDLKLALTEACSNSIRHAYPNGEGVVVVVYDLDPERIVIDVSDSGGGFVESERHEENDELSEGGLGMAIMRSIADELELGPGADGRGSHLRLVKRLAV